MTTPAPAPDLVPARVRAWAYPVALTLIALLVAYGHLDPDQSHAWADLAAALLGATTTTLATASRPTTSR